MTATLTPLSAQLAKVRLDKGRAVLVDIREADEFARCHIPGAISQPLSNWEVTHLSIDADRDVIFTCRSGMRTAGACDRLTARVYGPAFVLSGGVDSWEKAGLPLAIDSKAPLEIMRQAQIAAGLLVLTGVALGILVAPGWLGLSAFAGAGLTFAGATGYCGMARLLMSKRGEEAAFSSAPSWTICPR
jgi:rhodanese-related sulfurtransferase